MRSYGVVVSASLHSALRQLRVHPLRSFLTLLGIAIGIGSLIAMMGIGEGTRAKVIHDMDQIGGTSVLTVEPMRQLGDDPEDMRLGMASLNRGDLDALQHSSSLMAAMAPVVQLPGEVSYRSRTFAGQLAGTTSQYASIHNWQPADGRFLFPIDLDRASTVCVIGSSIREQLFPGEDPIGKTVQIRGVEFSVVGIMSERNIEGGRWLNELAILPLSVMEKLTAAADRFSRIVIKAKQLEYVPIIAEQVQKVLANRHGYDEAIQVRSQREVIVSLQRASNLMRFSFGSITLIVLLVGGIGIMNLMLVSVTERTREIGIHKAVGAHGGDIVLLFLAESVILAILGGVTGITAGVQGGHLLSYLLSTYLDNDIAYIITGQSIGLAVLFSIGIGLGFGLYPALKAAAIEPSKALSYE